MNYKARRLLELAGLIFDLYKVCFACPFLPLFPPRRASSTVFGGRKRHFHLNFCDPPEHLSKKRTNKQGSTENEFTNNIGSQLNFNICCTIIQS